MRASIGLCLAVRLSTSSTHELPVAGSVTVMPGEPDGRSSSRRTRPSLSRYTWDVVLRTILLPSDNVWILWLITSAEYGAPFTVSDSTRARTKNVDGTPPRRPSCAYAVGTRHVTTNTRTHLRIVDLLHHY